MDLYEQPELQLNDLVRYLSIDYINELLKNVKVLSDSEKNSTRLLSDQVSFLLKTLIKKKQIDFSGEFESSEKLLKKVGVALGVYDVVKDK